MRKKLVTVTKKDCEWQYFRGTGKGGQKRNKTSNCVRCIHKASGAVGKSEDGRSQVHNKRTAFIRMAETERFQQWLKIQNCKMLAMYRNKDRIDIESRVEYEIRNNIKVEVLTDEGWIEIENKALEEKKER